MYTCIHQKENSAVPAALIYAAQYDAFDAYSTIKPGRYHCTIEAHGDFCNKVLLFVGFELRCHDGPAQMFG